MALREKGFYAAIFAVLSFLGGTVGNIVSATWKTDDRIEAKARTVAEQVGADAARRVVKDEIGPAIGAAVAAAVKPLSDEVIKHIALDDERQRRTDDEVARLRGERTPLARHGGG